MNRRDAIRQSTLAAAALALWAGLPRRTWAAVAKPAGWSDADEALLTVIGDTILPETPGSRGAAAVDIGRFILRMTADCFAPEFGPLLWRGLQEIQAASQAAFARDFIALSPAQRERILTDYETVAAAAKSGPAGNPFRHIKQLTMLGYFTSEEGATRALRYDPVPGAYHGTVPLRPGDRSWAT
jgi:hypothetical protein